MSVTLLRVEKNKKKAVVTPVRSVKGSRMAHNEQWAVACCLMGRFIIAQLQLIPSDRVRPAAVHQKSRERERRGKAGNRAEVKNDVKGPERWERSDGGSAEVKWGGEKKDEVTMERKKRPRRKRKGFYIQQQDVRDTVYGA